MVLLACLLGYLTTYYGSLRRTCMCGYTHHAHVHMWLYLPRQSKMETEEIPVIDYAEVQQLPYLNLTLTFCLHS